MPLHPRKARTPGGVRASWPSLTGTTPHRATVPVGQEPPTRKIALPQCGHQLPIEAQTLYQVWEPVEGTEYPSWYCPTCKAFRLVNIHPGRTDAPLLF
jgi:hypothetical protein